MSNAFLSCDWGTSSFRLRLVRMTDGAVLAKTTEGRGIAEINNEWLATGKPSGERVSFYQQRLSSAIGELRTATAGLPIIISGMASSSIGMIELPYGDLPFSLNETKLPFKSIPASNDFPHEIVLVSGLKTSNDVMRGEETMLAGCDLAGNEEWLVIFPGTHSKHALVNKRKLVDFRTYMTGEIFELLSTKSILSKSVNRSGIEKHREAFGKGVREGIEGELLNSIFHTRTRQLLDRADPEENYQYLSGLLIGNELKGLQSTNKNVLLVCNNNLSELYKTATEIITGKKPGYSDADKMLVQGHCRLVLQLLK
jgi:2-dehydro-3-deoxygalactonokinase